MKILFINKFDVLGGAALAPFRLHEALSKDFFTENYFLVADKYSKYPNIFETRRKGLQKFLERGTNYLLNRIGLQYYYFPFSTTKILDYTHKLKPDVISLHNIHGGYFKIKLLTELSTIAPIVWTLHDMWAFTGNAAHTFGDESWKYLKSGIKERKNYPAIGINTGSWLLKQKKIIYSKSNITFVTPSYWLQNLAKQSPLLSNKTIYRIPNGVDLNVFSPLTNKNEIKKSFHLELEDEIIAFSAKDIEDNPYKGGKDLINIMKTLNNIVQKRITVLLIGDGNIKELSDLTNLNVIKTGYIDNEKLLARYLSCADLYIYPTKADNLPNTLIEAIACGLPCITYDIGGCKEIIKNGYNGYLINPKDINQFIEKIIELLLNKKRLREFGLNARDYALKEFSITSSAKNYFTLFTSVKYSNG